MAVYVPPALDYGTNPAWVFRATKVEHLVVIAAANCRPAKTEVDFTIDLIASECISKDTCAPFVKNYHKFSLQTVAYEIIPGIGKGCQQWLAAYNWTRRDALSDAGNNTSAVSARLSNAKIFTFFDSLAGALSAISASAFPAKADVRRACPDAP